MLLKNVLNVAQKKVASLKSLLAYSSKSNPDSLPTASSGSVMPEVKPIRSKEVIVPKMVTASKYVDDTSYQNIGDLPTGYFAYKDIGLHEIYLRPFRLTELPLIHLAAASDRGIFHLIRAVNACSSIDVRLLTDGDFTFVLAWLRKSSYPESPTFVRWNCTNRIMVERGTKHIAKGYEHSEMEMEGLEYAICERENNELVHQAKMRITSLDDDFEGLPDFLDFPRVATLQDYYDYIRVCPDEKEMAGFARWVRTGTTLAEKMTAMDLLTREQFVQLMKVAKQHFHGVYENLPLRCRTCDFKTSIRNDVNFKAFFADNTDLNIMDIQYSLLSEFSMQPDENMPVKQFLYHNSCLAKDRQAEEERRRLQAATRGR